MRPARKAREGRIPGVCNRRATPRPGMQRRRMQQDFGDATPVGMYTLISSSRSVVEAAKSGPNHGTTCY